MADELQPEKVETTSDDVEAHPVVNDVEGSQEEELALNKILNIVDPEPEASLSPVSDSKDEGTDAGTDAASDESEATEDQTVQTDAPPELERAIQALRRDNVPNNLLEKMTNEEVIEWGEKVGKRQSDNDEQFRQLRASETESDTSEDQVEVQPSQEESQPESQPDLDKSLQPVIDAMGLVDEEADSFKSAFSAVTAPLHNTITEQRSALNNQGAQIAQLASLVLAGRLTDQYPQLSDIGTVEQVSSKAAQLAGGGGYGNYAEAFADAARTMFAGSTKEVSKNMEKLHQARNLGTVDSQSTIEKDHYESLRAGSQEEKDDAILDLILDGRPDSEVQAAKRAIGA